MTQPSRPLNPDAVRAADDEFYANHPEFVQNGVRVPLSATDPAQAALRSEWVALYEKHNGPVEPDPPPPQAPTDPVEPCPCDFTVHFVTPGVDPVNSPNSTVGDMDQNEYTYSAASPGVLTVTLRARVDPPGRVGIAKPRVKFTVDAIPGSTLTWDGAGDGSATSISGDLLVSVATFTTLPASNADFGSKTARLFKDGGEVDTRSYEVFFPRDATNHPGGNPAAPNWFHYWSPLVGVPNLTYAGASGSSLLAEVRGMTAWSYLAAPDKLRLFIFDETVLSSPYRPYGCGVQVSGIDGFFATAVHENMHIQQIGRADPLVPTVACWRHGYAWNQGANHNHYAPGPDGLWGPAPGVADAAVATAPPFVAGQGDDVSIDASDHWPNAFGATPATFAANPGLHPIEREAVHASDAVVAADHANAAIDWGDPGKNHGTLNQWND